MCVTVGTYWLWYSNYTIQYWTISIQFRFFGSMRVKWVFVKWSCYVSESHECRTSMSIFQNLETWTFTLHSFNIIVKTLRLSWIFLFHPPQCLSFQTMHETLVSPWMHCCEVVGFIMMKAIRVRVIECSNLWWSCAGDKVNLEAEQQNGSRSIHGKQIKVLRSTFDKHQHWNTLCWQQSVCRDTMRLETSWRCCHHSPDTEPNFTVDCTCHRIQSLS